MPQSAKRYSQWKDNNHNKNYKQMENDIKPGKKIFIRNAGKDEYWLQDLIYENPSVFSA